MLNTVEDARVRAAAFEWLSQQVVTHGDVLPRKVLADGFTLDGKRVPLLGPQGIFKPQVLREAPLSITTSPEGPYDDSFGADNLLRYRYRGSDRNHPDNRGLRLAMERRLPLVYFHGVVPGKYLATWPVFVVADHPESLTFSIAVDDAQHAGFSVTGALDDSFVSEESASARRAYVTAAVRVRLHQRAFRERVLEAYQRQCSFCRLRHEELLDAAHIVPDSEPEGEAAVRNGLSLCKLHHAAFDRYFLGLRPDLVIEVRPDILRETDGPTLVYAIQALHGTKIQLPKRVPLRPALEYVALRYQRFLQSNVAASV
jgi:putative restriction endonuclease